jgi:alpha-galactosidase
MDTGNDSAFVQQWVRAVVEGNIPEPAVDILSERQGAGARMRLGLATGGTSLCLAGRTFERGLGVHADSDVLVTAPGPVRRLRAVIGVDDNPATRAKQDHRPRLVFSVEIEGRAAWSSAPLRLGDAPAALDIDLAGARQFRLRVRSLGDDQSAGPAEWYGQADWADARIELTDGGTAWLGRSLAEQRLPSGPPLSFRYDGVPSNQALAGWTVCRSPSVRAPDADVHTVTRSDPRTGLECRVEVREFRDFPAVEWVAHFRNAGTRDTPILEDIQALDCVWPVPGGLTLHRSKGSNSRIDDFFYTAERLEPDRHVHMVAGGGRSSDNWLPFFNLQTGAQGVILAIGWTGQWALDIERDNADRVHLRAGLELTHLRLHPGEEIRTPRILLLFWQGEPLDGNNLLRRFILAHHTPRQPDGRPIVPPVSAAMWGGMKTAMHLERIDAIARHKLPYDVYWIDAGWYGPPDSYSPDDATGDWSMHVGNWRINPTAHPNGLRPIADAAHAAGMKFLLWVEPERAIVGTPWVREHPEWFLGNLTAAPPKTLAEMWKGNFNACFNLGHPEARQWLTGFLDRLIKENGIDWYRQDFNFEPLPFWRGADTPDRQGMTEIRHIEGLYQFWDDLLRLNPGLCIDNCASGGRRIDLELIGRSVPLWRSDCQCSPDFDADAGHIHTMGLAHWVPLSATGTWMRPGDTYNFRGALNAGTVFSIFGFERFAVTPDYPYDWHRQMLLDYKRARPAFCGDYYPLVPLSVAKDSWAAYQMHRTDLNEGIVLAFRREHSPFVSADLPLRGLKPDATYRIEDADSKAVWEETGSALMTKGWRATLDTPRSSRLLFYRQA